MTGPTGATGPSTGPAGGVLSGTYPDPGFAVDMATQAELDAHINDATDAHDATAISFSLRVLYVSKCATGVDRFRRCTRGRGTII